MDMPSFLTFLKAIEHVCTQEKAHAQSGKKASTKNKTGTEWPSTAGAMNKVFKKVHFEKHCKLCKKHGGVHTMHPTKDCCKYEKDGTVKANFCTTKKAGKEPNPPKQTFAQLSNISWTSSRSLSRRHLSSPRNAIGTIAIPTAYKKLGRVALGN